MKKLIKSQIIICCLILISCRENNNNSFYTRHSVDDLSRIPLIMPYELLNQKYADSNYRGTHGWNLKFRYREFEGYISHLNISYINVSKGIIYGHGQDGKTGFPNYWVAIIANKKDEQIFEFEKDWKDFLKSEGVNAGEIFSVWTIFEKFEENSTLPWFNPKKNVYP